MEGSLEFWDFCLADQQPCHSPLIALLQLLTGVQEILTPKGQDPESSGARQVG